MPVLVREKRCRARPIELLSCAPFVQVAAMRLQPAGQELTPPVLAVVALLACPSPPLLPSSRHTEERQHVSWCAYVRSSNHRAPASY